MLGPEELQLLGNEVDRLISVEMRSHGFIRGIITSLSDAAHRRLGGPQALAAAAGIAAAVKEGDRVVITTGAGGPPWLPKGESDGPIGAAALARTIDLAFGAKPIYVGEEWMQESMSATSAAAGITVRSEEEALTQPHSAFALTFPKDPKQASVTASELLERYAPVCLVATEKLGPNSKGIIHSGLGSDISAAHCRVDLLFREARRRGIFTIGVGDNGNEIGFGTIHKEVKEIHPLGTQCACPCGGGLGDSTETDVLVVANVSNWGCYGICAMLAAMLHRPELLHDAETERRLIERCAAAGAFDGSLTQPLPSVDGLPLEVHMAVITQLHAMVAGELRNLERKF